MAKKKATALKLKVKPVKFSAKPAKFDPKKMEDSSNAYAKAADARMHSFSKSVK